MDQAKRPGLLLILPPALPAVQQDSQDPQLLANLQKLGEVHVPRGKVKYQPRNDMLNILAARQRDTDAEQRASEDVRQRTGGVQQAAHMKNRLSAGMVLSLLDERKQCKTRGAVEKVARGYDVDVHVLERLARYVNAPSVAAGARLQQHKPVEENEDVGVAEGVARHAWLTPRPACLAAAATHRCDLDGADGGRRQGDAYVRARTSASSPLFPFSLLLRRRRDDKKGNDRLCTIQSGTRASLIHAAAERRSGDRTKRPRSCPSDWRTRLPARHEPAVLLAFVRQRTPRWRR